MGIETAPNAPAPSASAQATPAQAAPEAIAADIQAPVAAPIEAPKNTSKPEDDLAHRFAILSRKQKSIFEEAKRVSAEKKEIEEAKQIRALAKSDPAEFFKSQGLSLDDVLRKIAGEEDKPVDKVSELEKRLAAYEEKIEADKKAKEQQAREEQDQKIVANFKNQIKNEITQDLDKYEAINATDSFDEVFNVCRLYYETHGEVPPVAWAAEQVENELIEQARKYQSLKKLAPKEAALAAAVAGSQETAPVSEHKTPSVPTLTNRVAPEPQLSSGARKLSDEESKAFAAKMIKWT